MNFIKKYIANRRFFRIAFAVFAVLFALLAFITYYGQNAGNFVMSIDDEGYRRGLILSERQDFSVISQWLSAEPVEDVMDTTYGVLDIESAVNTDGSFKDRAKYLAYTFYVKNTGKENTMLYYNLEITDESKDLSKAIRVLVITDGVVVEKEEINEIEFDTFKVYMAPDEVDYIYPNYMPETTHFVDSDTICVEKVDNLRPEQAKRFTVLMWLEGEDPECIDKLFGSKIKIEMNFSVDEFE